MIAYYPSPAEWKQCLPTTREEVTRIISDMSQNGVIRGRVFYDSPRYKLTVTHHLDNVQAADFEQRWDNWIVTGLTLNLLWAVDGKVYEGIPANAPTMEYIGPKNYRMTFTLLCKQLATPAPDPWPSA
jgi:hypothetical protein